VYWHWGTGSQLLALGSWLLALGSWDAALSKLMADHKFKIGQMVYFRPRRRLTDVPRGNRPYQVVQRLFVLLDEPQYRIKGSELCSERKRIAADAGHISRALLIAR